MANWICIIGNNFVESSSDNVLIRITVILTQASQDIHEKQQCECTINFVNLKWRKTVDTPWPKRQVVWNYCFTLSNSMLSERPEDSTSLKISDISNLWNVISPTNPNLLRIGWVEDIRKSKCHFVMKWIELSLIKDKYSIGNDADFWLVLLINKPNFAFNRERC